MLLTLPPQALVGAGLALTLSALTEAALAGSAPQAIHGGWTIAARHAGVVAGLLVLTPVFTADLETERAARRAGGDRGAARLRRSRPASKLDLATKIADRITAEGDKVPVVDPAFEPLPTDPDQRAATIDLRDEIRVRGRQRRHARVQRLVSDRGRLRARGPDPDRPRAAEGGRPRAMTARTLIASAVAAAVLLAGVYLAAGGGAYEPTPVADPCAPRAWTSPEGAEEIAQQFFLSALDGAACELGVSRETLAAALATEESRQAFAAEHGVDGTELEAALRAGLIRAIDDAEHAGAISGALATGLREFASRVPRGRGPRAVRERERVPRRRRRFPRRPAAVSYSVARQAQRAKSGLDRQPGPEQPARDPVRRDALGGDRGGVDRHVDVGGEDRRQHAEQPPATEATGRGREHRDPAGDLRVAAPGDRVRGRERGVVGDDRLVLATADEVHRAGEDPEGAKERARAAHARDRLRSGARPAPAPSSAPDDPRARRPARRRGRTG